jgi:hypothetical protein
MNTMNIKSLIGAGLLAGILAFTATPADAATTPAPPTWAVKAIKARQAAPPRTGGSVTVRCLNSTTFRVTNWTALGGGLTFSDGRQYGIPAGFGSHIDLPTTAIDWAPGSAQVPAPTWYRVQFSNLRWLYPRGLPSC